MADIIWKTASLPVAIRGVPYEAGLAFTGNATAVTAGSVTSGALPTGLVVNASDHVRITGTPTAAPGAYPVTITLTDTAGAVASSSMTLYVRDAVPADDVPLGTNKVAADIAKLRWP